ncbi:MAG TPA: T9SS type A sorting domain-containing protein [Prolixibacteraceae bacterium]|nr:T9SS type A sorting domain-containing protein [Prolixibacteraceae bacterium]HPS11950.1 T9SS type A sorting domain-containing protein [Prolixibacteraceae bacterium]
MKTKLKVLLVFLIFFQTKTFPQKPYEAEITYIGNEGFMICNNGKKVIIDGLYFYGNEGVAMDAEESTRNLIINNKEPFTNNQLFLVTHNHGDHYNQSMVSNYLKNNPQSKLIAPSDIAKGLASANLGDQILSVNPAKYESIDTTINNIQLTIYNFLHDISYRTYNVGYFMDIDGLKVFHGGDNSLEDSTEYIQFKLNEKNIDVLFLWNYKGTNWATQQQRDFIKKYINPKYIILMHVQSGKVAEIKEQIKNLNDSTFPPMVVFGAPMEKVKIDDTITITNHMPEKIASLPDTTITVNTPIRIQIPSLFKDPDANDTLTYYTSALPAGLDFDSKTMCLTGSVTKAKNYTIKVLARDKGLSPNNTTFKLIVKETTSAITNESTNTLSVYPNPASSRLFIKNGTGVQAVKIFNEKGEQILNRKTVDHSIDISTLPRGIYTIQLIGERNVSTSKFIKE